MSFCTMVPVEEKIANSTCCGYQHPHTILYNILSWKESDYLNNKAASNSMQRKCHCRQRRVCLKNPKSVCQVASSVLIKTIFFMRSLPSFSQLPLEDQSSLLRHCWVPLFVLGLAQERIAFEVTDVPNSSILRDILLRPGLVHEKETDQPTLAGVHMLRTCLHQLWELDVSPKEYAYLRGAMLFNPAVQGLNATLLIEGLQKEALWALQEVVHHLHPEDASRFRHILLAASAVQSISHSVVTALFFKPVIGNTNMSHLLTAMMFVQ